MVRREQYTAWVKDALGALGGRGHYIDVAKEIWKAHGDEIRLDDSFYTWQYDFRWGATALRKSGVMAPSSKGIWELK